MDNQQLRHVVDGFTDLVIGQLNSSPDPLVDLGQVGKALVFFVVIVILGFWGWKRRNAEPDYGSKLAEPLDPKEFVARYRATMKKEPVPIEPAPRKASVGEILASLIRHLAGMLGWSVWVGFAWFFVGVLRGAAADYGSLSEAALPLIALAGAILLIFGWMVLVVTEMLFSYAGWKSLPALLSEIRNQLAAGDSGRDEEWEEIPKLEGVKYHAYLQTPQWKQRREFMLSRYGYRCQICNGKEQLQLHHRTYQRIGAEKIQDLTVLCGLCHAVFHRYRGMPER